MAFLRSIFVFVITVGLGRSAIVTGPFNDAFESGPPVTLTCTASGAAGTVRVSWYENITNSNWAPISDNDVIISGHPNAARYSLNYDGVSQFDLSINPTVLTDGGAYRCVDVFDSQTGLGAQLITIAAPPNCTTNIPSSGYVREGQYYTMECEIFYRGNVAPTMTWTGPGSFLTATITTNITVTSGVAFNATRFQSGFGFTLLTNFTAAGFIQPNYASNVPTWSNVQTSPALNVQWEPKGLYIVPEQSTYNVGDTIECHADANPAATFFWQNLETNERWDDFRLYCSDQLVGSQRMRCNAANNISGIPYTADYFFNLTVNPRPTTPVPTTITTTTAPLPETVCDDLTGRWQASAPNIIDMCLEVNNTDHGRIVGIMRNATDPYFIEIRGRILPNTYNQIGLTGVWPTAIGSVTMIGTCRKCYGIEYLQFNGLSRTTVDNTGCTNFGSVRYAPMYLFSRVGPPCRGLRDHLL